MCAQVLQGGECIPPACPLSGAARTPRRNGGHLNPPLYHDYVRLKSDFGVESAKRIIRFRRAHLSALREAVEEIGALDHSQIRDVEKLDVYFDHDTFKEGVQALEVWRKDMPEEAADSRVIEGSEAAKVSICFSSPGLLYRSDGTSLKDANRCSDSLNK
jgi:transposase InsO family protein